MTAAVISVLAAVCIIVSLAVVRLEDRSRLGLERERQMEARLQALEMWRSLQEPQP